MNKMNALKAARQEAEYLLEDPNIVGVGIGYKEVKGVMTDGLCIVVSVIKKHPRWSIADDERIPWYVAGVPTDVLETGQFVALQDRTARWRPAPGGVSIGHKCYDNQTRVLTRKGLRHFSELASDDEIATLNTETGELEYHRPLKQFRYWYKGSMIHFKGKTIDLLVTPNHNIYYKNRYSPKDFGLLPAEKVLNENSWGNIQFKRDAKWVGELDQEPFIIPPQSKYRKAFEALETWGGTLLDFASRWSISYKTARRWNKGTHAPGVFQSPQEFVMDDWLAFLGWYISEGSTSSGNVCISEKSGQYHSEILVLLNRMDLSAFIASSGDVRFAHKELSLYLKRFGTAKKKYIPEDIKNLPTKRLRILLDSLMKGDGHFENGKYRHYKTVSRQLAHDVFEIGLKCGYGVTIQKYQGAGHFLGNRWIQGGPCYRIGFSHVKKTPRLGIEPSCPFYDGYVYCVEIPNHVLFVERNGKTCWSGNSITAGTLGCLVTRGGERFILSNNHVLAASNQGKVGDEILQQGKADGGTVSDNTIATLYDWVAVKFLLDNLPDCPTATGVAKVVNLLARLVGSKHRVRAYQDDPLATNLVDAAIARPIYPEDVIQDVLGVQTPTGHREVALGDLIIKSGRTSAVTRGKVTQVDATINVGYGDNKIAMFVDQVVSDVPCGPGDSGSIVLADDGSGNVVGLLFAGDTSGTIMIMSRIQNVLDLLGVTID